MKETIFIILIIATSLVSIYYGYKTGYNYALRNFKKWNYIPPSNTRDVLIKIRYESDNLDCYCVGHYENRCYFDEEGERIRLGSISWKEL